MVMSKVTRNCLLIVDCRFTIIRDNFIFTNIRELEPSRIQHSRETFAYIEFI